jgi:hypothetical protein
LIYTPLKTGEGKKKNKLNTTHKNKQQQQKLSGEKGSWPELFLFMTQTGHAQKCSVHHFSLLNM